MARLIIEGGVPLQGSINISGTKNSALPLLALTGTEVTANDLRASVALVLAGLAAKGTTTIYNIHHLDRGYQALEEKLNNCGANITRVTQKIPALCKCK